MRKRNKVKQLNRTASHRRAMLRNMATSLFEHERILTTRAKSKVLRSYAEKLITRARVSLDESLSPASKLHHRREVLRDIANEDVVTKLFGDIAPRFKDRPGGYTRIIHLPERHADSAQMSIIELVDRKEKTPKTRAAKAAKAEPPADEKKGSKKKASKKDTKKESKTAAEEQKPKEKGKEEKKGKWWSGFRKKKGDEHGG